MGDLGEVEDHGAAIPDGVVLAADGLSNTEDHCSVELEEQDLTAGGIEQLTFFVADLEVAVTGADRLNALALQGAHLVDREDVGDEDADAHGGDQVHQNGEGNHQIHNQRTADRDAVGALDEAPVDDVDTDLQGDAREDGLRDLGGHAGEGEDHHHQDQGAADAREGAAAAALDVDHGAHGGAGAGQATEEAGGEVAEALANQFFVGVVLGAGDAVGHHRGQQGIDAAEHAQHGRVHEHQLQFAQLKVGDLQGGESRGDFPDAADLFAAAAREQRQGEHGAHHQGN